MLPAASSQEYRCSVGSVVEFQTVQQRTPPAPRPEKAVRRDVGNCLPPRFNHSNPQGCRSTVEDRNSEHPRVWTGLLGQLGLMVREPDAGRVQLRTDPQQANRMAERGPGPGNVRRDFHD